MVHARVLEAYINFAFIYTADHILPVLPIKYLVNEDTKPTMPFKLATCTKPSIFHLRVLFCPRDVHKATAHIVIKSLNMSHQAQKGFHGVLVGIPQHQKGYLVYVTHKRNIVSLYDVVLMRVSIVRWRTRHKHTKKLWL